MNDITRTNAEKQIINLLTELNDFNPETCRGLWYHGGLDEGNKMTIYFKEGKTEGCGCDE